MLVGFGSGLAVPVFGRASVHGSVDAVAVLGRPRRSCAVPAPGNARAVPVFGSASVHGSVDAVAVLGRVTSISATGRALSATGSAVSATGSAVSPTGRAVSATGGAVSATAEAHPSRCTMTMKSVCAGSVQGGASVWSLRSATAEPQPHCRPMNRQKQERQKQETLAYTQPYLVKDPLLLQQR